jgi:small-conductance mechanosensitive channel
VARFNAHVTRLQSAMDAVHRAMDDRAPDDLRDALESFRSTLLSARSDYSRLRDVIASRTDRLYDQNKSYGDPPHWPAAQAEKLSRYQQEAADITTAEDNCHFLADQTNEDLSTLHHTREEGVDPLAESYDLYDTRIRELNERFGTYQSQLAALRRWL